MRSNGRSTGKNIRGETGGSGEREDVRNKGRLPGAKKIRGWRGVLEGWEGVRSQGVLAGAGSVNLSVKISNNLLVWLVCTPLPLASFAWFIYQKDVEKLFNLQKAI